MDNLKSTWDALTTPVKAVVGGVAAVVALIVIFKILPWLVGAMSAGAIILILILPYWIPTVIAFLRHHPSKGAILATNLLLGWTFVGWVVSLVWALSDNSPRGGTQMQTIVVNNHVGAMAAAPAPQVYQVGDVVNGYRFDGTAWLPAAAPARAVPPPPPAPIAAPIAPPPPPASIATPPTRTPEHG